MPRSGKLWDWTIHPACQKCGGSTNRRIVIPWRVPCPRCGSGISQASDVSPLAHRNRPARPQPPQGSFAVMNLCRKEGFMAETILDARDGVAVLDKPGKSATKSIPVLPSASVNKHHHRWILDFAGKTKLDEQFHPVGFAKTMESWRISSVVSAEATEKRQSVIRNPHSKQGRVIERPY